MHRSTLPVFAAVFAAVIAAPLLSTPVLAQGQGGYAPGVPGAETVRMPSHVRARARAMHQTNDTSGGISSIDKSGQTWEGGNTTDGPQQGSIQWGAGRGHYNMRD